MQKVWVTNELFELKLRETVSCEIKFDWRTVSKNLTKCYEFLKTIPPSGRNYSKTFPRT